jgi:hypothetical protein
VSWRVEGRVGGWRVERGGGIMPGRTFDWVGGGRKVGVLGACEVV